MFKGLYKLSIKENLFLKKYEEDYSMNKLVIYIQVKKDNLRIYYSFINGSTMLSSDFDGYFCNWLKKDKFTRKWTIYFQCLLTVVYWDDKFENIYVKENFHINITKNYKILKSYIYLPLNIIW